MDKTLSIGQAQEWVENHSNLHCEDCGEQSLEVTDTFYDDLRNEENFDKVSPHQLELECKVCGYTTRNSLLYSVVKQIRLE
jgi:ribosomal protein L37E